MLINVLKGKLHRATVTEANLNYVGSISIDKELAQSAGFYENERVQIVNNNNGERFETYVIYAPEGSKIIGLNGAAARLVQTGDRVIIMAYGMIEESEINSHKPVVVFLDESNSVVELGSEKYGEVK